MNDSDRLQTYFNARQPCILIQTFEEAYASEMVLQVAEKQLHSTLA